MQTRAVPPSSQTVLLLFWPVVWVVWAFVFRGGLTYMMMGLARFAATAGPRCASQCAWRALLVWAPVVGLTLASVWLDAAYWSAWPGDGAAALDAGGVVRGLVGGVGLAAAVRGPGRVAAAALDP